VRKTGLLLVLMLLLSGCATYKFQKGPAPYDKGYVGFYDDKLIPEYTLGKDNSVPDLVLAKERFNRRHVTVERYYKRMGQIETRFKAFLWDPPVMLVDFLGGLLRWPFIAVADYKYNHNHQYKEKVDRLDEQTDELEKARVNDLKAGLKVYIDSDLAKELARKGVSAPEVITPAQQAPVVNTPVATVAEAPVAPPVELEKSQPVKLEPEKQLAAEDVKAGVPAVAVVSSEVKSVAVQEKKKVLPVQPVKLEPPVAVIIAKPAKGPSPLQVNFNGGKSYSKAAKIVAYDWDFGDGDTSAKKNPLNTYWSTTYGSRIFTATLTVKDEKGQTASASMNIEVIAK